MAGDISPLESAKARITIFDLWLHYNLEGKPGRSCRAPHRPDRHPSFSVTDDGLLFYDFAEGIGGDQVDFIALIEAIDRSAAAKRLIAIAGGCRYAGTPAPRKPRVEPQSSLKKRLPPTLPMERRDAMLIQEQRDWPSVAGVEIAVRRGFVKRVYTRDPEPVACWTVADSKNNAMQLRRLDGAPFTHRWDKDARQFVKVDPYKSKTFGCASWPVGAADVGDRTHIIVTEGPPDALAAYDLLHAHGHPVHKVCVVSILGAGNRIHAEALPYFNGKIVRIIHDADAAGQKALEVWAAQLRGAGAGKITSYTLNGILDADNRPVKDLADLVRARTDWCEDYEGPVMAVDPFSGFFAEGGS